MPDSALPDTSVLTSSFYETYIRQQVIVTCTSGTRPTGVEGRRIFETDTELEYVYTGSAWIAMGNAGAWTSYTPTLTQSGGVTFTTDYSKYTRDGRKIDWIFALTVTGSGMVANNILLTTPVTMASQYAVSGVGRVTDVASSGQYNGVVEGASTTQIWFLASEADGAGGVIGTSPSFQLTNTDTIRGHAIFEAAS